MRRADYSVGRGFEPHPSHFDQSGRPPADIDVLVVGMPDRDDLDEAAERAGRRLGREVNVTVRSPQWWDGGQDGFHVEVTARPLVPVLGTGVAVRRSATRCCGRWTPSSRRSGQRERPRGRHGAAGDRGRVYEAFAVLDSAGGLTRARIRAHCGRLPSLRRARPSGRDRRAALHRRARAVHGPSARARRPRT
jgi:hypothetical protein